MNSMVLVPYGNGFLQLTGDEFATVMSRGIAPATNAAHTHGTFVESTSPERWLNSQELSEVTGVGDTTLESWAAQGKIPCIRAGKALRFKVSEVEAALRHADSRSSTHMQVHERSEEKRGSNQRTTAAKESRHHG